MKKISFMPVALAMLMFAGSCAPGMRPPAPPRPPKPPRPPHGAIQMNIPDTSFQQPTVAFTK